MTTPDPELTGGAGNAEDQEPGPAAGTGAPVESEAPAAGEGGSPQQAPYAQAPGDVDPDMVPQPSSLNTLDDGGEAGEGGAGSSNPTGTPDPEQTQSGTQTDLAPSQGPGDVDPETPNAGEGGSPRQADYTGPTTVTQDPEMPTQG